MSSITVSLIVFASVFGGSLLGVYLRSALPPHHLSADSKDIVRLGMGLVGTMAALVLGLLVASAKSSYDSQSNELTQLCANIISLDRTLARYGPETKAARDQLRGSVVLVVDRVWPKDHSQPRVLQPANGTESLYDRLQELAPKDDMQSSLRAEALSIASVVSQTRWLMYEQNATSVPLPMLVILVLWLTIIFVSFGLFAPCNTTVVASLFVSALSVSCAILLILEMYKPFQGLIQISPAPLYAALSRLGQ
jgi:Protein of unknown function (DUF4239)